MKLKLILYIALFVASASSSFAQSKSTASAVKTEQAAPHRIVYDMSAADTAQHAGLMRQLNNIKRGWPDAQIEVVVHGKALHLVVADRSYKANAIRQLQAKGVVFAVCENTMRFGKVVKDQLLPGVITVPMGIGEIILKQEEGWGYIKF